MPAAFNIEVRGTENMVRRLLEIGQDAPKAATRAINRTLATVRTASARALSDETGLQVSRTRRSVRIRKASFTKQIGTLAVTGRKLPFIAFRARQTRRGVSVVAGRGGRRVLGSAFITKMRTGHIGVFMRAPGARYRRKGEPGHPHTLPIREQYGPSLPGTFVQAQIDRAMIARGNTELETNLRHEIDRIIKQRGGDDDGGAEFA